MRRMRVLPLLIIGLVPRLAGAAETAELKRMVDSDRDFVLLDVRNYSGGLSA